MCDKKRRKNKTSFFFARYTDKDRRRSFGYLVRNSTEKPLRSEKNVRKQRARWKEMREKTERNTIKRAIFYRNISFLSLLFALRRVHLNVWLVFTFMLQLFFVVFNIKSPAETLAHDRRCRSAFFLDVRLFFTFYFYIYLFFLLRFTRQNIEFFNDDTRWHTYTFGRNLKPSQLIQF